MLRRVHLAPLFCVFYAFLGTLTAQTGQFVQAPQYPVGSAPEAVAVGDFNGDGKLDVAVANFNGNSVTVLLGNGDGTFRAAPDCTSSSAYCATDSGPKGIATGDFNGDGKLDIAVTNWGSSTLSVFLGNGDGTFQSKIDFQTGNQPWGIAVGKLAGNDNLDIVVTNSGDNIPNVGVFIGSGTGVPWTLATQVKYNTGTNPVSVAIGDVNGDGYPDLVVANDNTFDTVSVIFGKGNGLFQGDAQFSIGAPAVSIALANLGNGYPDIVVAVEDQTTKVNAVDVLIGDGTGSFAPYVQYSTGLFPTGLAVGDFNGDGNLDVAVSNSEGNTITVHWGAGDGTFQGQVNVGTGGNPYAVAAADFNNDGATDLVAVNYAAGSVSVILSNGNSDSFQARQDYAAGSDPVSIAAADFNGDGKPDLVVGNYGANTVSIEFGNGDGTFQAPTPSTTYAAGTPRALAVADFNGDNIQDIAVADYGSNTVSILLGQPGGTFSAATKVSVGSEPVSVAVGDFNGDGIPDLAVANFNSGSVSVLLGNGQGGFTEAPNSPIQVGIQPISVVVTDLGNGESDLVVVNKNAGSNYGTVSILLGTGNGTFTLQPNSPQIGPQPISIVAGNFGGKGFPDLAVAFNGSEDISVLIGNGDGTFETPVDYGIGAYPSSIVTADFNGDGNPDLALTSIPSGASLGNAVSLLLGNGDGTFKSPTLFGVGYLPSSAAIGDFNGDGALALAVANSGSNTVSLLLNAAQAVPTMNLVSSGSPSSFGQSVTFTITVTASVSNGVPPTGTVTIENGSSVLGSGPLVNEAFSVSTPALPTGSDPISAIYSGDSNYQAHTVAITQTVQQAAANVVLVSSLNPSNPNQSVTFTATVTSTTSGQPTGTVTFLDGATVLGSSPLNGEEATFTTGPLSIGTHTITARYSGDGNFNPGTSPVLNQVAGKASTSIGLTSTPASPDLNQTVTFTATIMSAITTTPTGTVTFADGTTQLGTAALNGSGVATFSTSSLAAGEHSIAAAYSGDANFLASTSAVMSLAIATPNFTLSSSAPSLSVAPGASVTSTITITPSGGLSPSGVALTCSISPVNTPAPTCSLGSVTVTNNAGSSTLTIAAAGAQSALASPGLGREPRGLFALGLIIPAILLGGAGLKKPNARRFLSCCIVFFALSVCLFEVACGSAGQASSTPGPSGNSGTPAGLYTITVTGSSTGVQSQTATISLAVK